jgi:hypothetical protein
VAVGRIWVTTIDTFYIPDRDNHAELHAIVSGDFPIGNPDRLCGSRRVLPRSRRSSRQRGWHSLRMLALRGHLFGDALRSSPRR